MRTLLAALAIMILLFFTQSIITRDVAVALALIVTIAFIIGYWHIVPEQFRSPLERLVTRFKGIVETLVAKSKTTLDDLAWSIFQRYLK